MFKINKPNITIKDTYPDCTKFIRDSTIKDYILSIESDIYQYADNYNQCANRADLHLFDVADEFSLGRNHNNEWLVKLYKYYLSCSTNKKKEDAFRHYSNILKGGNFESVMRCCYCNNPPAKELDHFLPESKYMGLAINPMNLIPSCHDCNKSKSTYSHLESKDSTLIHPYYDDISEKEWLEVSFTLKVKERPWCNDVKFSISETAFQGDISLFNRAVKTAEVVGMMKTLSSQARSFVDCEIIPEFMLGGEYYDKSNGELKLIFERKYKTLSRDSYSINHWKVAIYKYLYVNLNSLIALLK